MSDTNQADAFTERVDVATQPDGAFIETLEIELLDELTFKVVIVTDILAHADVDAESREVHGLLCGVLLVGPCVTEHFEFAFGGHRSILTVCVRGGNTPNVVDEVDALARNPLTKDGQGCRRRRACWDFPLLEVCHSRIGVKA